MKKHPSKEVIFHENKEKEKLVDTGNRYMQEEEEKALNSGEVTRGDALDSKQNEMKQNKSNTPD